MSFDSQKTAENTQNNTAEMHCNKSTPYKILARDVASYK